MPLGAEIKFRCERGLLARFERIAALERRDKSDLARIVFEDYVALRERALKLTLRDAPTPKNVTPLHHKAPGSAPGQETRYRKSRRK